MTQATAPIKTATAPVTEASIEQCCLICGSNHADEFLTVGGFTLVRCFKCETLFVAPQPPDGIKAAQDLYSSDQYEEMYFAARERLVERFDRVLIDLDRLGKKGRLLDVGCSYGFFLERAAKKWEPFGVEPCKRSAQNTQKRLSLPVFNCRLDEAGLPDRYFDVVTMWDVLEHLPSPIAALNEVARILKDDGILFLQCPNIHSLMARIGGYESWGWLDLPDHLFQFSPRSLEFLLEESHFNMMQLATWEPLHEFLDTVFDLYHPVNLLSDATKQPGRLLHSLILAAEFTKKAASLLSTPIAWLPQRVWCKLNYGGLIQVFASKKGDGEH